MFALRSLVILKILLVGAEDLQLVSKSRTINLERYDSFADAVILNFRVPKNTIFASFKFVASEEDLSIFGCTARKVSVYLKYGSPPVINPDGSAFPKEFKNISRSKIYSFEFETNKTETYINITSPEPGSFYAAVFLSYEDPRYRKISQQGLSQSCSACVDASLYIKRIDTPTIVSEYQLVDVISQPNISRYFMFLVPEVMDNTILNIESIVFPDTLQEVLIRVQAGKPPTNESFLIEKYFKNSSVSVQALFHSTPLVWHYIEFQFIDKHQGVFNTSEFTFNLRFYSEKLKAKTFVSKTFGNLTFYNMSVVTKYYHSYKLIGNQRYKQYDLVRDASSESFTFSYKLSPEVDSSIAVPINITSQEFSVLKFHLQQGSDIGGTLQYILAFKPQISRKRETLIINNESHQNYTIVGCIQRNSIAVPTWPVNCISNDISILSPLALNKTTRNSTILIPYPEGGTWYASFKLFCGMCEPCNCPKTCQEEYENCVIDCELNCTQTDVAVCDCPKSCSSNLTNIEDCSYCDCDGPCLKSSDNYSCNASIIFDISSHPCYYGDCGKQGKCVLMISEGTAYSTCLCSNNYRGFDCSDGSRASPYFEVLIEFLLLVLSNIFFFPATYIAFKRHYYVESLSYFSIFLSSTFYHACDAGENILSFCLFRLSALQFSDFYSALLAIWLTLLAIADLPSVYLSLLQMAGSIIIAFSVTLNRYAFWIFALPSSVGIIIILLSWYSKYRKYGKHFLNKKYLCYKVPVGICIVVVGLVIYGLLQTQDNYKYLHSLWHITMATSVFFLLPQTNTFQNERLF